MAGIARLHVLVSAYACDPSAGSEPGAGWVWARAAAEAGHSVTLLTRSNNHAAVDAGVDNSGLDIRPVYLDLYWALRAKRGSRRTRLYYILWQAAARKIVERLHREQPFDVAHHVTFAMDWLPAAAVGVRGLPAVWGPVGGHGRIPLSMWRWLGARGVVRELLREGPVRLLRMQFGRRNASRATLVVALNDEVASYFAKVARRVVVEPNAALPAPPPRAGSKDSIQRALFVGRLIALKGPILAVEAMRELGDHWRLDLYGDGPERRRIERSAYSLGLIGRVRFHGHRPRQEVADAMRTADVLLFPSMHDSAPWTVAEALSVGTPVVAFDLLGPGTMLRRCGIEPVQPGRDPGGRLARAATAAAAEGIRPCDRWHLDRLPALIDGWYRDAMAATGYPNGHSFGSAGELSHE